MTTRLANVVGTAALMLFLAGAGSPASADWLFTPYLGVSFGGDANFGDEGDFEDTLERKMTFGGSATWMGAGIVGVEIDFGTTPNLFTFTSGDDDFEFGDGHLTTLMGNIIVGAPIGGQTGVGVRPYGTVGVGLLRSSIDGVGAGDFLDDLSSNDLGFNAGAGAHVFFNDNVGLRGDIRYFRTVGGTGSDDDLVDLEFEDFDFWRGTVGVTFRFGGN
jgi:opacity protein-like surface antigen